MRRVAGKSICYRNLAKVLCASAGECLYMRRLLCNVGLVMRPARQNMHTASCMLHLCKASACPLSSEGLQDRLCCCAWPDCWRDLEPPGTGACALCLGWLVWALAVAGGRERCACSADPDWRGGSIWKSSAMLSQSCAQVRALINMVLLQQDHSAEPVTGHAQSNHCYWQIRESVFMHGP